MATTFATSQYATQPVVLHGAKPFQGRCYAIRITYPHTQIPGHFWLGVLDLCEAVFATAHNDTESPHVHIAIFNSKITHDALRKELVNLVKANIEDNPPKGNALMSVKKWDTADRYLVYMLKGQRHMVCQNISHNFNDPDTMEPTDQFNKDQIEYLRSLWKEGESTASIEYKAWMDSVHRPIPVTLQRTVDEMLNDREDTTGWLTKTIQPPFDTIRDKAIEFSMIHLKVPALDSKVKHMAKNLISNYCWFMKVPMKPVHI